MCASNQPCLYLIRAENMETASKSFAFPIKNQMPLYYVSASDGTNVVKVISTISKQLHCRRLVQFFSCFQLFRDAISAALAYKRNPTDFTDQIMNELEKQKDI